MVALDKTLAGFSTELRGNERVEKKKGGSIFTENPK